MNVLGLFSKTPTLINSVVHQLHTYAGSCIFFLDLFWFLCVEFWMFTLLCISAQFNIIKGVSWSG